MSQKLNYVDLLHFRRTVSDMYAAVRQSAEPLPERWIAWRETRDQIFAHHSQSPLTAAQKATFTGLDYYPYDPAWRFEAAVDSTEDTTEDTTREPTIIPIETEHDGTIRAQRFAKVHLTIAGKQIPLSLFWLLGYGGGVFLPFRDATNGQGTYGGTYGGGRYLLDTIKHADLGQTADGKLILDFNYAYNPSCAYNHQWSCPQWSCPLAPPENQVPIAVSVGEQRYSN